MSGHTSEPLIGRPSRPTDADTLTAILQDTFESTWRQQTTEAAATAFRTEAWPLAYVAERGLEFLVGERDGAALGFVHWDRDFAQALHVRSSARRTGVGTALMDAADAASASTGHPAARLETDTLNARSQPFCTARGYGKAGRLDKAWGSGLRTLLLVKTFGADWASAP